MAKLNLPEEDYVEWDWTTSPAIKFNQQPEGFSDKAREFFGDHFDAGLRYRMVVKNLKRNIQPDTGKQRIDLEAVCTGGEGKAAEFTGKTFKTSFFFPLTSELEGLDDDALRRKTYHARLFNSFVEACGHDEQDKVNGVVPFPKIIGDEFEFEASDWTKAGKPYKKVMPDGTTMEGKGMDRVLTQINKLFRVEKDMPNPTTAEEPDIDPEVEEDFNDF